VEGRQPWRWHLDRSVFVFGLCLVIMGLSEYGIGRENEHLHRLGYPKGAPATPTQSYLGGLALLYWA